MGIIQPFFLVNKSIAIANIHRIKQKADRNKVVNFSNEHLISIGDTPSCSLVEKFIGIDEIRPGIFSILVLLNAVVE